MLNATREITFLIKLFYEDKEVKVNLTPRSTPLLLALCTLADWGVVPDFRDSKVMLIDRPGERCKRVEQSEKGSMLIRLSREPER